MVLLIKWDNKVDNLIVIKSITIAIKKIELKKKVSYNKYNFDDV